VTTAVLDQFAAKRFVQTFHHCFQYFYRWPKLGHPLAFAAQFDQEAFSVAHTLRIQAAHQTVLNDKDI
jgi:hypothetical protein